MDNRFRGIRYGFRSLAKSPGFMDLTALAGLRARGGNAWPCARFRVNHSVFVPPIPP